VLDVRAGGYAALPLGGHRRWGAPAPAEAHAAAAAGRPAAAAATAAAGAAAAAAAVAAEAAEALAGTAAYATGGGDPVAVAARRRRGGGGALGARRRAAGAAGGGAAARRHPPVYAGPSPASEAALSNLLVTGAVAFAGLLFLRFAVAVGLVGATFLLPAWRTFQLAEAEADVAAAAAADPADAGAAGLLDTIRGAQRRWGAYWVLAALGVTADALALSPLRGWVVYSGGLLAGVCWLTRRDAAAAAAVYDRALRPLLVRWEGSIGAALGALGGVLDRGGKEALVRVSGAVTPYARALEEAGRGAAQQLQIER